MSLQRGEAEGLPAKSAVALGYGARAVFRAAVTSRSVPFPLRASVSHLENGLQTSRVLRGCGKYRYRTCREGSGDWKSEKEFSHKTFPRRGRGLECGRSLGAGRGEPAALARGEPDRMTSSAALSWNAAVREEAGLPVHLPSGTPTTTTASRSPRRHFDTSPPPRPFPSHPRAGRSVDGPLLPASSCHSYCLSPPPVLCPPPSTRNMEKPPEKLERPRAAARSAPQAFLLARGRLRQALPVSRPRPSPESRGGRRVPVGAASPRRVHAHPGLGEPRASSLLPSFREPQGPGRGRTRRQWRRRRRRRVPARSRGESLGRSAPPWPRAPRAGSGAGAGCGRAPSSRLPPPARRRGPAPSRAPNTPPGAAARAGGGVAEAPGQRSGAGGAGECAGCPG